MANSTLWRDDDISVYTCPHLFKDLHQKFIDKKQTHTVAVVMKDLWQNHALFWYLATAPFLEIGLHGWEHKDYSKLSREECFDDLSHSLHYWENNITRMLQIEKVPQDKKIKTFFAPWNRESENIISACIDVGLQFCNVKGGWWNGKKVKSFHWWNVIDDNFKLNL